MLQVDKLKNVLICYDNLDLYDAQNIEKVRHDFIYNGDMGEGFQALPEEIQSAWIESKKMGVKPDRLFPKLDIKKPFVPKSHNDIIIASVYHSYYEILLRTPHKERTYPYFCFVNTDGIIVAEFAWEGDIDVYREMNIGIGTDLSMGAVGAIAPNIAMAENRAVQLMGSLNYLDVFEAFVMTAVPVTLDGLVIGAVCSMNKYYNSTVMLNTVRRLNHLAHRSSAFENAIKAEREKVANDLIKQTISQNSSNLSNNIITIDDKGNIAYICNSAKKLIAFDDNTQLSHYILDINKALSNVSDRYINKRTVTLGDNRQLQVIISCLRGANNGVSGYSLFLQEVPDSKATRYSLDTIIGEHKSLNTLKERVHRIATTKHNILILGESGTGKEVVAQAIHEASGVKGPFVAINCASIPANLIESELFGYVEGAFTGASKSGSIGKIEYANNGTLFLDEIGDMPLALQPVLLRVLEERQVVRIGGKTATPVNVRVIAATNVSLHEKVLNKEFREDLYFRLSVITANVPPLRDRGEDVLLLAKHFIDKERAVGKVDIALSGDVEDIFLNYTWPGNIRQLENVVISAIYALEDDENIIEENHLPMLIGNEQAKRITNVVESALYEAIVQTLKDNNGNLAKTARDLDISRSTLYNKMKAFGLKE